MSNGRQGLGQPLVAACVAELMHVLVAGLGLAVAFIPRAALAVAVLHGRRGRWRGRSGRERLLAAIRSFRSELRLWRYRVGDGPPALDAQSSRIERRKVFIVIHAQ